MNRRIFLACILGATVLAVGLGSCHMFLEDWGTYDAPCTADRHCQKDFYCHADICLERAWCDNDQDCFNNFDLASHCDTTANDCVYYSFDPKACTGPEDESCPPAWDCAEFDAIYPALAKQYDVEFYPFFLDGVATVPKLFQADGMHPTAKGVDIIVQGILPRVEALIGRVRAKHAS